jgi:hypothetical protein
MGKEADITSIIEFLRETPGSIREISQKTGLNWRTVIGNLDILRTLGKVNEKKIKNARVFYLKEEGSFFKIPVMRRDHELITTIYAAIKRYCFKGYGKNPTKTHVYKILYEVNKKFGLNLPIGWYRYGPCCVQIYNNEEKEMIKLSNAQLLFIKEITEKYCAKDTIELQKQIYQDEHQQLYITKERLFSTTNKQEFNALLMDLVKYAPEGTKETVTEFVRAVMLLGWSKMLPYFGLFWKYVTMVRFKETLSFYVDTEIYFDKSISNIKNELQSFIFDLVKSHTDTKYSQDTHYQSFYRNARHSSR